MCQRLLSHAPVNPKALFFVKGLYTQKPFDQVYYHYYCFLYKFYVQNKNTPLRHFMSLLCLKRLTGLLFVSCFIENQESLQ